MLTVAVAFAAGAGALARFVVDRVVQHHAGGDFPLGTLLVNVTGSLVLGLVVGLAAHHGLGHTTTVVVGTGFAGGYTTLSTWAWESLALAAADGARPALANAVGSVVLGLLAAAAGLGLGTL